MQASIDIGSNTVLLLIGEPHGKKVTVIDERQKAPRLGRGVDAEKNLSRESIERVIEALQWFKSIIKKNYPEVDAIRTVATSAVRDARNRTAFAAQIKEEAGLDVEILSGEQEALFTYWGAKSVLSDAAEPSVIMDIGGGSTEVAVGINDELSDRFSFNIGSVRFTERYLPDSPPTQKQVETCKKAIADAFKHQPFELPSAAGLIGVAGTVTSLASIEANIKTYQPEKLNGKSISLSDLSSRITVFSDLTAAQLLERYPVILKGRSDVILAGLLILEVFMEMYHFKAVTTSTGGIRHGALLAS
jgi:exopolyphosphatase/guanosine-5'-triphosphate,3'-diphosphate pyrophosphatase